MSVPSGLTPLVDGDILRYEVGFAAETGWAATHPGTEEDPHPLPPWDYVRDMLYLRLASIQGACNTTETPVIYYTTGPTFRYDIAKKKPYKGQRKENKPWHFNNLTTHLKNTLNAKEITYLEADDQLAMDHLNAGGTTIICSRDKDLRQIPGWSFSWELGRQPSFGPELITKEGWLRLGPKRDKIVGTGLAFFYSQVLTGDTADNIPGCPGVGPVAALEMLEGKTPAEQLETVIEAYEDHYEADIPWAKNGNDYVKAHTELLEQGRLCWLTRRMNEDGSPELWTIGMTE